MGLAVRETLTTWRHSSVGQSIRFIPEVSPVRIQSALPKRGHILRCVPFPSKYGPLVKWLRHRPFTAVTWVRVPYGSPDERNPLFEHFYRKAGLFLSSKPCEIEAFSFTALTHKRKNSRNAKPIFYARTLFEHGFLINSFCMRLQMPAVSCISRFDEGGVHCKIGYTTLRFCGSFVLRCTLCGMPLLF